MHATEAQERTHLLRPFPGSLPQGDGDASLSLFFFFLTSGKTVGIRDMCVPIHTPRSWSARGRILVVFGRGGRTLEEGGWLAARRVEGRGRGGKTTGPTLSTAAIRRQIHGNIEHVHRSLARGLHELYGLSFFPPRSSLLLRTSGCSLHARHSGPRTEISSTRGYVKRATSPASMLPPTARADRVSVA